MKITVVGSGYVGLVTGACLADVGHHVMCLDLNESKIAGLNKGIIPIHEPGLDEIVERTVASGNLLFTTDIQKSVDHGDVQFIAVGTPPNEDGSADLNYVKEAAKNIAKFMKGPKTIVNKSTVPVGSADAVKAIVTEELKLRGVNFKFDVVSNPEFLKEGAAIEDFARPDRIVIGSTSTEAIAAMKELYAPFSRNHDKLVVMDARSAELTKYAANAMLATRISFMNEMALLAERVGADIEAVRLGIGSDPRIGYDFLYAGCGYGGSCFPKDVKALVKTGALNDLRLQILESVESVNARQKTVLHQKIKSHFGGNLRGKKFAVWGLAFKPNTDDMREASSLVLINGLLSEGAKVSAFDPTATENAKSLLPKSADLNFAKSALEATQSADALVIVTEWKQFKNPDFESLSKNLVNKVIFDGRNILNPAVAKKAGYTYYGIGRSIAKD